MKILLLFFILMASCSSQSEIKTKPTERAGVPLEDEFPKTDTPRTDRRAQPSDAVGGVRTPHNPPRVHRKDD